MFIKDFSSQTNVPFYWGCMLSLSSQTTRGALFYAKAMWLPVLPTFMSPVTCPTHSLPPSQGDAACHKPRRPGPFSAAVICCFQRHPSTFKGTTDPTGTIKAVAEKHRLSHQPVLIPTSKALLTATAQQPQHQGQHRMTPRSGPHTASTRPHSPA